MQRPSSQSGKKPMSVFMDAMCKITEDYNRLQAQTAAQRAEMDQMNAEKMKLSQQQMLYYQTSCITNMEMQKQTEAAQRWTSLLQSVLQHVSPELRASANQTLERAQKITTLELMQMEQNNQAQQMQMQQLLSMAGGQMGMMGGGAGGNPGALGGQNGMNMAAMNAAMGAAQPAATPTNTPVRAPPVKKESSVMREISVNRESSLKRERRSPSNEPKLRIVTGDSDEEDEIDVTSDAGDKESVYSGISTASTLNRNAAALNSLGQQNQENMAQLLQANPLPIPALQAVPNGKTAFLYRDGTSVTAPTVIPTDALTDPAVPKRIKPVYELSHGEVVCSVAISKDSKRVFTGGKGSVKIWDLTESTQQARASINCHEEQYTRSCKLYSNDTRIAVAGEFPDILLFDVETQQEVARLNTQTAACYALTVDDESKMLYACCDDGTVVIYELASLKEVSRLRGHNDGASCVALSKDGNRLFTGSLDQTLRTWNLRQSNVECIMSLENQIFALDRSPIDDWVVVGQDKGQIEVVSTIPGPNNRYHLDAHESGVLSMRYAHSGRWFCSTGKDDMLKLWTSPHGALAAQTADKSAVLCCEISADDKMIVTGSKERATVYQVMYDNAM